MTDLRLALIHRERIAWGGTLGIAVAAFACVFIGMLLATGGQL